MEVVAPCDKLNHLDISNRIGSSVDPQNPTQCSFSKLSMKDLDTCLAKCLNIEEGEISADALSPHSGKNDISNAAWEHDCRDANKIGSCNLTSEKCLSKCATFPSCRGPKSSEGACLGEEAENYEGISAEVSEVNGSTTSSDQHFLRSVSLPLPSKLVSAMKGSRKKQGVPPKNLSVTWAPDVYDPIPTSVSHVPSYTNQRHHNSGKKSGRYKKGGGKSSRGGNSKGKDKDKKQGWKNAGGSSKQLKALHEVDYGRHQVCSADCEEDVGSLNSCCERSFRKTSVTTNVHFPAAEAT